MIPFQQWPCNAMQVFKDLQRQLHPDKNPQDQEADSKLINIGALPGMLCFPMFFTWWHTSSYILNLRTCTYIVTSISSCRLAAGRLLRSLYEFNTCDNCMQLSCLLPGAESKPYQAAKLAFQKLMENRLSSQCRLHMLLASQYVNIFAWNLNRAREPHVFKDVQSLLSFTPGFSLMLT